MIKFIYGNGTKFIPRSDNVILFISGNLVGNVNYEATYAM